MEIGLMPWTVRKEGDNEFWECDEDGLHFAVNRWCIIYLPASYHKHGEAYAVAAAKQFDRRTTGLGSDIAPALLVAEDGTPYVCGYIIQRFRGCQDDIETIERIIEHCKRIAFISKDRLALRPGDNSESGERMEPNQIVILLMDRSITENELEQIKQCLADPGEPEKTRSDLIDESAQLPLVVDKKSAGVLIDRWEVAYGHTELVVFGPCPVMMRAYLLDWAGKTMGKWNIWWHEPHYILAGDPPVQQFHSWQLTGRYSID